MKKKKKKLKDDAKVTDVRTQQSPETASDVSAEERPMDFGGLPNRDLKKNLGGCG